MTLLAGAGASDLSFHLPKRGLVACALATSANNNMRSVRTVRMDHPGRAEDKSVEPTTAVWFLSNSKQVLRRLRRHKDDRILEPEHRIRELRILIEESSWRRLLTRKLQTASLIR